MTNRCAYLACDRSGEYENHRYEFVCADHYLFELRVIANYIKATA